MQSTEQPRYELKMVCQARAVAEVTARLRLHPAGLRPLHPRRWVQSIYFDTHEGRALADNLAGISERRKLRVRWYGLDGRGVRGTVECKQRVNMLGTKLTHRLATPLDVEGQTRAGLLRALTADLPAPWREELRGLEPVQWIRYQRDYWVTADREVRVTIDRDLQACDLRYRRDVRWNRTTPIPQVLVIEFKCPPSARPQVEALVQAVPLMVDKCSKFVLASAPEHGPTVSLLE